MTMRESTSTASCRRDRSPRHHRRQRQAMMSSSDVFSETPSAQPSSTPADERCVAVDRRSDSDQHRTASIQNAFQRLSVRNSIDFRKNGGRTLSSSAAHDRDALVVQPPRDDERPRR